MAAEVKYYFNFFQTPIDDNKDFAVLKFHAGPPYEVSNIPIVFSSWLAATISEIRYLLFPSHNMT